MSYIGRNINNLSDRAKLDSISTSATATFNLLLNSVAYVPSSAESLTVSLNGVIQAPTSSYNVSGSTIIFASNLASSDVINFILAERAITLTTIGSGTVTTSNIVDNAVTTDKLQIANNNTSVGNVRINDKSGDQSAGNPQYTFSNNTGTGMRRATGDTIAFDTGSVERLRIDATGIVTLPTQSGFQAQTASEQSNLAINAFVTLLFATEISDTNADYNAGTSTFTSPVTGKYLVTVALNFNALDFDASYFQTQIKTSNREYTKLNSGNQWDADPTNLGFYQSMIVDMDASDTCIIRWYQGGGTAQADLRVESFFAMQLLA